MLKASYVTNKTSIARGERGKVLGSNHIHTREVTKGRKRIGARRGNSGGNKNR